MQIAIYIFLEIILLIIYSRNSLEPISDGLMYICLPIVAICTFLFFRKMLTGPYKKQWIKPSNIFYLSYLIVNFQMLIDYWIGYKTVGGYGIGVIAYTNTLGCCMILGCSGLVAFTCGYCLKKNDEGSVVVEDKTPDSLLEVPTLLIIAQAFFFALFIYHINVASFISGEVYATSNEFAVSNYYELLFCSSTAAIVVLRVYKRSENVSFLKYLWSFNKFTLLLTVLYMGLRMLSGDRGPVLYTFMLYFFAYEYLTRKSVNLFVVGVATFAIAVGLSIIGIARMDVGYGSVADRAVNAYNTYKEYGRFEFRDGKTIIPATEELSASCTVTQIAVNEVKNNNAPYHHGMYQLVYLLNPIPKVPGFLATQYDKEELSSANFVDKKYLGEFNNSSLGTTIVADFFLEYDIWAVMLGLFVVGLFYREIDALIFLKDKGTITLFLLVVAMGYSSRAVYIPRSTFLGELKEVILIFAMIIFYKLFTNSRQSVK